MRGFFRGWKRKTGCVTLVLACVLTAGWVRSHFRYDELVIYVGTKSSFHFQSDVDLLVLEYHDIGEGCDDQDSRAKRVIWRSDEIDHRYRLQLFADKWTRWSHYGVLSFGQMPDTPWGQILLWYLVPYWSIVAPLTLLSAWLLLSKPPQPKPLEEPSVWHG